MSKTSTKYQFIQGPISPDLIAACISKGEANTSTGAYDLFLGQVRADVVDRKTVAAIEYTTYREMAENAFEAIIKSAFKKFELKNIQIYHSLGIVKTGKIGLFVLASSAHRKPALEAVRYLVEEIKAKVPIFGKELFDDNSHQWKANK